VPKVPTANEYRVIKARLQRSLATVTTLLRPVVLTPETTPFDEPGGELERTVDTALTVTGHNLAEIAAELKIQIDEAVRRAAVCERYSAAVSEYRRSNDPAKRFPVRPASWAEHGR
jgi:hypothetical protein